MGGWGVVTTAQVRCGGPWSASPGPLGFWSSASSSQLERCGHGWLRRSSIRPAVTQAHLLSAEVPHVWVVSRKILNLLWVFSFPDVIVDGGGVVVVGFDSHWSVERKSAGLGLNQYLYQRGAVLVGTATGGKLGRTTKREVTLQ